MTGLKQRRIEWTYGCWQAPRSERQILPVQSDGTERICCMNLNVDSRSFAINPRSCVALGVTQGFRERSLECFKLFFKLIESTPFLFPRVLLLFGSESSQSFAYFKEAPQLTVDLYPLLTIA